MERKTISEYLLCWLFSYWTVDLDESLTKGLSDWEVSKELETKKEKSE